MPPTQETDRVFQLPIGAKSIYRELKDTSILEIPAMHLDVDASHLHLAKLLARLQQLAIGYLPVDNPDDPDQKDRMAPRANDGVRCRGPQ